MRKFLVVSCLVCACMGLMWSASTTAVHGQVKKKVDKKKKPIANTEAIDTKVKQVEATFIRETEQFASDYFDAGHYEKARELLEIVVKIKPDSESALTKIKYIDEQMLTANDLEVEVNAAMGWQTAKVMVTRDQPIRMEVEGTYRFVVNTTLDFKGFPAEDVDKEMSNAVAAGGLMGVIVNEMGKPGRPFPVMSSDFKPDATGKLFFRVNAPADNKNVGKIKVKLSGAVKSI